MNLVTINSGSSSLKFALYFAGPKLQRLLYGQFQRVGVAPSVTVRTSEGECLAQSDLPAGAGHAACLEWLTNWFDAHQIRLDAVSHRVVHGGTKYQRPVRVTPEIMADLEAFVTLAPLHQPHNLAGLKFFADQYPGIPQVACFDTAFHTAQSDEAQMFALPRHYFDEGVRAYGFHGLSYEYVSSLPQVQAHRRVVVLHLGSGASACAIENGKSVASTMGFTALDGLMMSTRCGALDAGVVLHLLRQGLSVDDVESLLYKKSGLLGVSGGVSSDVRDLVTASQAGNKAAEQALELFAMSVAGQVAKLITRMGGVDALVFTAGIGENSAEVRAMVIQRLAFLGIDLDAAANQAGADVLSTASSAIAVLRVGTDEEAMMATHGRQLLATPSNCTKGVRVRCDNCEI